MAKTKRNIILDGLSGAVGKQLLIRQYRAGHTVVGAPPVFKPDRAFSELQLARQLAFREAAAYAVTAKDNPLYTRKAAGTARNSYNLAISDWLHPPEILALELGDWHGQPGAVIRIQAQDDVQVCLVTISISDPRGALLEQGPARQVDPLWWEYTTTSAASGSLEVLACAQDLPGHVTQLSRSCA